MSGLAQLFVLITFSMLATPHASDPSVTSLKWLAGCWELRAGDRIVTEQWSQPRGRMMLGSGHTTKADSTVEYEQTRILERGSTLVYAAHPSGQVPAEFVAEGVADTLVVFANPAHDFPQRVIYRRRGADSLIARVEGERGGRVRGFDFPYRRVPCAP
jgi:uncharacterized protein DUF6265